MPKIRILFVLAGLTWPGWAGDAGSYVRQVQQLLKAHDSGRDRLQEPAELTGRALIAGGSLFLTGTPAGWVGEGSYRAGGLGGARPIRAVERARAGDVIWLSYSDETYESEASRAEAFEARKCLVLAFGPRPAAGKSRFTHWIDSLAPDGAERNLTLLGNVVSLWTVTAEVAAYCSRQGKTPVFLQSAGMPGGMVRNTRYENRVFHTGPPSMKAVAPGVLTHAYLDCVAAMFAEIVRKERNGLKAAARQIATHAADSQPVTLMTISHMMPSVISGDARWFQLCSAGPQDLPAALARSGYLVWLGYYGGIQPEVWDAVRHSNAGAAWIAVPNADQHLDFGRYGDVFIDQHWAAGDSAIELPGYDIKVLPPSGLAQLFIYEFLMHRAGLR